MRGDYELNRIESVYGSVAEYNRCMWEEENYYEPTDEEIAETERQMAQYYAEIERLNGEPSKFIKTLVEKWKATEPQYDGTNESIYAGYDWSRERCIDIVEKIAEHYRVTVDEKWESFYRVPKGKYAISIEYQESCYIKNKHIGSLDLDTFKNVFRDLHYARLSPTMSNEGRFISNVSLGHLLKNYIREEEK